MTDKRTVRRLRTPKHRGKLSAADLKRVRAMLRARRASPPETEGGTP